MIFNVNEADIAASLTDGRYSDWIVFSGPREARSMTGISVKSRRRDFGMPTIAVLLGNYTVDDLFLAIPARRLPCNWTQKSSRGQEGTVVRSNLALPLLEMCNPSKT